MNEFPAPMVLVCATCGELILASEEPAGSFHLHHDSLNCGWLPDDDIDELGAIIFHEAFCDKQVAFHDRCCRYCSIEFAGV